MQYSDAYEIDAEPDSDLSVTEDLPNFRPASEFETELDDEIEDSRITTSVPQYEIPDLVKNFITHFHRNVKEQNIYEIHSIYENSFNKLTEKFYKSHTWPPAESIAALVGDEPVFLILYKELYYRHIYSKLGNLHMPNLQQRCESWQNYCDLFNYLLNENNDFELELPNQWLWDIIDEFIYQFQSFCQYKSNLNKKEESEKVFLKENPEVWNVHRVLNILHSLITKSQIVQILEQEKQNPETRDEKQTITAHPLYRILGFFSMIGLLRIHCLLGDYYLALKVLEPIDLTKKGVFSRVTACHITLYYYMGFAYLMMRRYMDAVKAFTNILIYINRTKQYHTRSYQYESILKKNEQMYALLALAVSLCPTRIDENIHSTLKDKYGDKMLKMQKGELIHFEELFSYSCPKFISPSPANFDEANVNHSKEALSLQLKLFLQEVNQQVLLPTIRSYLKLYTTIPISKLAAFLKLDENHLRTHLLCYKHKTRNLVWTGGSAASGKFTSASDIEFYLDQDMIHIADSKVSRRYGEFFIRHINKFQEIIADVGKEGKA